MTTPRTGKRRSWMLQHLLRFCETYHSSMGAYGGAVVLTTDCTEQHRTDDRFDDIVRNESRDQNRAEEKS